MCQSTHSKDFLNYSDIFITSVSILYYKTKKTLYIICVIQSQLRKGGELVWSET